MGRQRGPILVGAAGARRRGGVWLWGRAERSSGGVLGGAWAGRRRSLEPLWGAAVPEQAWRGSCGRFI